MADGGSKSGKRAPRRRNDADAARKDILAVAIEEFAANGLAGARVDSIADKTRTSKRMLYYYFGSKEGLYVAALEQAYAGIRSLETGENFDTLAPVEAMRRLVELTFDHHDAHPDFIRLVAIENIHHAEHLKRSAAIRAINDTAIGGVADILQRGQASGDFRRDIEPVDVHLMISALCFFRVSNRSTFGAIFDLDFAEKDTRARHRRMTTEAVLRLIAKK